MSHETVRFNTDTRVMKAKKGTVPQVRITSIAEAEQAFAEGKIGEQGMEMARILFGTPEGADGEGGAE